MENLEDWPRGRGERHECFLINCKLHYLSNYRHAHKYPGSHPTGSRGTISSEREGHGFWARKRSKQKEGNVLFTRGWGIKERKRRRCRFHRVRSELGPTRWVHQSAKSKLTTVDFQRAISISTAKESWWQKSTHLYGLNICISKKKQLSNLLKCPLKMNLVLLHERKQRIHVSTCWEVTKQMSNNLHCTTTTFYESDI